MNMHLTSIPAVALLAGAGCIAAYACARRALLQAAERRRASERQMRELVASVKALESRVTELSRGRHTPNVESISEAAEGGGAAGLQQPKPEVLAVMTAAAAAFLGKTAWAHSARHVSAAVENVSPWSRQGRVIVQTSHNLRTRE